MSKGYAPGWQVRCPHCGTTRPAAEVGIIRIGAASKGKRTLGWCSVCRRVRVLVIEQFTLPQAGSLREGEQRGDST